MIDVLVTFETAELAKEKGFDLLVNDYYCIDAKGKITKDNGDGDSEYICLNHNKYPKYYSAPTQSLLQKWLRETHGVYIGVYHDLSKDREGIQYYTAWGILNDPTKGGYDEYNDWKTYEEALEVGLQEALKRI